MANWIDGYWWSNDGLRLHYRDYPANPGGWERPTILCMPGLTRNARDFADLADRLAGDWRLICVELRGRGESAYSKDPLTYVPLTYVQDVMALVAELGLVRPILFGTSLGGILAMLMVASGQLQPSGVLLNDIGPEFGAKGLDRIRTSVGRQVSWPTWIHAARGLQANNASVYPDWQLGDWLAHAKRLCRLSSSGRIKFDYDMRIAEPFRLPGGEAGVDLWPAFDALRGVPTLLVRGALSDLLDAKTAARMAKRHGAMEQLVVPRVGHAPLLSEPECVTAIDMFLASLG